MLVHELAPLHAVGRNDRVPVGNGGDVAGVLADGLADLRGEVRQIAHRGILFKNDLAVLLRINLQRVAAADNTDTENLVLVTF